ncbi:glycosyltransferase family 2 protein [Acetobacter orleanensis]|nr:glycosyltransferase family 2 protein [Acetobacter orleanensis]KXV65394.1 hypothetical protein AD949_04625 [Acetobacter orleanensis]
MDFLNALNQRAKRTFDAVRSGPCWQVRSDVTIPALRYAALLMLVKDEADIIGLNLRHHYRLGFRRFFILDNNSSDGTAREIELFRKDAPQADIFYAQDYQQAYYQAAKMQALQQFVEIYLRHDANPPDWIFFVDADEFITCCHTGPKPEEDFSRMLADPEARLLMFHWAQAALVTSAPPYRLTEFGPTLAETECVVWPKMREEVTKVALRTGCGLTTGQGNHFVEQAEKVLDHTRLMMDAGFCIVHFPQRSIEQIKRKLLNGMNALQTSALPSEMGKHWREQYAQYQQEGTGALRSLLMRHLALCLVSDKDI